MRDGRLFRYSETGGGPPEAALLEQEFAAWQGARYCVAVNSGGCALFLALRAAGVGPGDKVLLNAFTLAPVPGAIAHAGADPVLVDITPSLVPDLEDLDRKAAISGAKVMIASHMRGHFGDLDALASLCARHGITLIEDCAHAPGATWQGRKAGSFGQIGCFSAQSYKHLNGGEGGLIVTDDPDLAAKMILMSGSYMLYQQHLARPEDAVFDRWKGQIPNHSMRMSGLTAALLRPQLTELDDRIARWRDIHKRVARYLANHPTLELPSEVPGVELAPTSLQFLFRDYNPDAISARLDRMAARGVGLKWFGAASPVGFTSRPQHWEYVMETPMPRTDSILLRLCDLRLPLGLSDADADLIGSIIAQECARDAG